MIRITGVFESGTAARTAIARLHEAGVSEDDVIFLPASASVRDHGSATEASERTGARVGAFAADVGETGVSFVPFVGRDLVDSPMGRALRDASETTGALAGRLFGAMTEGGFSAGAPGTPAAPDMATTARASVTVRLDPAREAAIRSILSAAGAATIELEG